MHFIEPLLVRQSQRTTKRVVVNIHEDMLNLQKLRTYVPTDRHTKLASDVLAGCFYISHHNAMTTLTLTTKGL